MTYTQAAAFSSFVAFVIIALVAFAWLSNVMGAILFSLIAVGCSVVFNGLRKGAE